MKKRLTPIIVAVSILTAAFTGCVQDTQSNNPASSRTSRTTTTTTTKASTTNESTSTSQKYILNIGSVLDEADPIIIELKNMAEKIKERTSGAVTVNVHPSGAIGDTAVLIEQIKYGGNVGTIVDSGMLAAYAPDMAIYSAPYVFDSVKDARKFIETDIFEGWNEKLAENGLRDLSFNFYQGARHFLTNVEVKSPDDLKDLKIRTMGSDVAQNSMKAFGANPVSLGWNDVYAGIENGEIDAAEAQLTAVYGAKLHEVVSYIAESGHFLLYTGLIVSEEWFSTLPATYKTVLLEEAKAAGDAATELTIQKETEVKTEMEAAGVKFVAVDIEPFKEASKTVFDEMGWQTLKQQIDAALSE